MRSVAPLMTRGNAKMGESIFHFDLPAIGTCPGRSQLCESACYARRGHFARRSVQDRLARCHRASKKADFAPRLIGEIRRLGALVVRVHVSGDFYSPGYVRKWVAIAKACPGVRFFAYTRSWRVRAMAEPLGQLASLGNVRLWLSCDAETGLPDVTPPGARRAWLQVREGSVPAEPELLFRVRPLRGPGVTLGLPMVCPQEDDPDVNCGNCQHCWR